MSNYGYISSLIVWLLFLGLNLVGYAIGNDTVKTLSWSGEMLICGLWIGCAAHERKEKKGDK